MRPDCRGWLDGADFPYESFKFTLANLFLATAGWTMAVDSDTWTRDYEHSAVTLENSANDIDCVPDTWLQPLTYTALLTCLETSDDAETRTGEVLTGQN